MATAPRNSTRRNNRKAPGRPEVAQSNSALVEAYNEAEDNDFEMEDDDLRAPVSQTIAEPRIEPSDTRAPEKRPEKFKYIITTKTIDSKCNVRKRIPFTPAVCEICGFDVCEANNLPDYYDMNAATQDRVREALKEHKIAAHSQATKKLIDEEELPEGWLGHKREQQRIEEEQRKKKFGVL